MVKRREEADPHLECGILLSAAGNVIAENRRLHSNMAALALQMQSRGRVSTTMTYTPGGSGPPPPLNNQLAHQQSSSVHEGNRSRCVSSVAAAGRRNQTSRVVTFEVGAQPATDKAAAARQGDRNHLRSRHSSSSGSVLNGALSGSQASSASTAPTASTTSTVLLPHRHGASNPGSLACTGLPAAAAPAVNLQGRQPLDLLDQEAPSAHPQDSTEALPTGRRRATRRGLQVLCTNGAASTLTGWEASVRTSKSCSGIHRSVSTSPSTFSADSNAASIMTGSADDHPHEASLRRPGRLDSHGHTQPCDLTPQPAADERQAALPAQTLPSASAATRFGKAKLRLPSDPAGVLQYVVQALLLPDLRPLLPKTEPRRPFRIEDCFPPKMQLPYGDSRIIPSFFLDNPTRTT